jgi:shikimate dehydrogenase
LKKYGLIGRKLGHSLSQELFEAQGFKDASYGLYEMESLDGLRQWVEQEHINGFNVTIPYKQKILPLLDAVDDTAAEIGAVNCVSVEGGRLVGHNTDAPAFQQTLEEWLLVSELPHTALILGTGGAARAVAYALKQLGVKYRYVSRYPELHKDAVSYDGLPLDELIINATPIGMYPDIDSTPLPLSAPCSPRPSLMVYDLIYNPSQTLLMRDAAACGAKVKNGLDMLRKQAEMSWDIWGL